MPGYDILPHVARSRPDLAESHTALLLSSYLQADLPTALIEVTSVDIVAVENLRYDFWVSPFLIIRILANFRFYWYYPN